MGKFEVSHETISDEGLTRKFKGILVVKITDVRIVQVFRQWFDEAR